MLVHHDRPRNLPWYLAGPMLFGDLGTSRLYVLGLAIYYAGRSAPYSVGAVCALILVVGWAYSVICRVSPDGGGVYSSGRAVHPTVGVVGAILLFTDYVVTAALSGYEAISHICAPFGLQRELVPIITIVALVALGVLNYVGPRRAGTFALIVAIAAIGLTLLLALLTAPQAMEGIRQVQPPKESPKEFWLHFVAVVLAISGIEAVASMTGMMRQPVGRTSKRTIWPVVIEVIVLNIVLVFACMSLQGIPEGTTLAHKDAAAKAAHAQWESLPAEERQATPEPPHGLSEEEHAIQERVLEVLAREHVGPGFALIASIVFGLLLLSASNTAIVGMTSIQFLMSRDGEIPRPFAALNRYGVPWIPLLPAIVLPCVLLMLFQNLTALADLYAIGVVGAITINLLSCAYNRKLDIRSIERICMWSLAGLMVLIWATVAVTKVYAAIFLAIMLAGGLGLRLVAKHAPALARRPVPAPLPAPAAVPAVTLPPFDPARGRILVASRGNMELLKFAFDEARRRSANVFVVFVRQVALPYMGEAPAITLEEDREASTLFASATQLALEHNTPMQPVYAVSASPAEVILDFAATYAADLVILGVSRRAGVLRALQGDVISTVADHLPKQTTLLIHA